MANKTEPPTEKRLRDARARGEVPRSKELVSAVLFTAVIVYLKFYLFDIIKSVIELIHSSSSLIAKNFYVAFTLLVSSVISIVVRIFVPILGLIIIFAVFSNVAQIGFLFAPQVIVPNFERINFISGLKKIFSKNNLIEFFKVNIKIIIIGVIIGITVMKSVNALVHSSSQGIGSVLSVLVEQMERIVNYTIIFFLVIAGLDVFVQRKNYFDGLRMSIEEVRREYKNTEGDPLVKRRRQQLHREITEEEVESKVKSSNIVISNPTHFAVALFYREKETRMPIVKIKGKDHLAKMILRFARKFDIPIVRKIALAQDLYRETHRDSYIPRQFIIPIVKIIHWLKKRFPNKNF